MPTASPIIAKPELPAKIYLRRKEVEGAVGGQRQLMALERAGRVAPVLLPGYQYRHYVRAQVQQAIDELWGR